MIYDRPRRIRKANLKYMQLEDDQVGSEFEAGNMPRDKEDREVAGDAHEDKKNRERIKPHEKTKSYHDEVTADNKK